MKLRIVIVLMVSIGLLSSCKKLLNPRVKYFVDGTSTNYSVRYLDENGQIVSLDTIPYDWSHSFDAEKGDPVMIEATSFENDCWVKVYVYIDGKLLKSDYRYGDKLTARVEEKVTLVLTLLSK